MNGILLDTSAYSAAQRNHVEVVQLIKECTMIALNPVIMGELLAGFKSGNREQENRRILEKFITYSKIEVLSIDEETAERYAVIRHYLEGNGSKISANDYWIAATAMQYSLTLVTLDQHFQRIPHILVRHF